MPSAVLDANVWVSAAAYPGSVPDQAVALARAGRVRLVTSEPIIAQVRRALLSPRLGTTPETVAEVIEEIRALSEVVVSTERLAVITAKESDNRVLECAVAGRVDVIVTGDRKHLLPLGSYEGIPLVAPRRFVESVG